ncbi:MAG: DUF3137 domain-containing protein [Lachnospiraceae bacterium]|nr:DUF3137 domain-containing protein [Lachnospiraceae bacterium]
MDEMYYGTRNSNEAMIKLQEKRNAAGKTMLFILFGALLILIPPIGLIMIFYGCSRMNKLRAEMRALYKDAFVREPLENNFENVLYEPNGGYSYDVIESFRICEMGNRHWSEDFVNATYAGVNFQIAEVNVREVDERDDHTSSTTYFEGRMMVFYFPNKLVNSVSVFSRKFKHRALSRREEKDTKVELESARFNKEFDVYSPYEHDAFYLLTPHFMERLEFLGSKYESIAMTVYGNRVVLAFNEPGKNVFDANVEIGKLDIEQEMAKVQSEIDDIKMFIATILG